MTRLAPGAAAFLAVVLFAGGCSIKRMAVGGLADALASSAGVFAADEDPELVRDALPFSLKTIETLLDQAPRHPGLLLSACSGFTQYAYAFLETDAEVLEPTNFEAAQGFRERARKMYLRAKVYCLRRLELRHPNVTAGLASDPQAALQSMDKTDVPVLYWAGASWGSAIALGLDRPALIAELPAARALMVRALALDEGYDNGAIHAAMIAIEALPETMGGSPARARQHFDRAVELSRGLQASPYVVFAVGVCVKTQDRTDFTRLLQQALAIDVDKAPQWRLANLIAQKRAAALLARVDDFFVDFGPTSDTFGRGGLAVNVH